MNLGNYIGSRDGWQLYLDGVSVCAKKEDVLIRATLLDTNKEVVSIPPDALLDAMRRSDRARAVASRLAGDKRSVPRLVLRRRDRKEGGR